MVSLKYELNDFDSGIVYLERLKIEVALCNFKYDI